MSKDFKAPDKGQEQLHFLDYWRIIRIRKAVILTVFFLVMLTTAGVTTFLPNKYESEAAMVVQKDTPDVSEFVSVAGSDGFDPYWMQTQFEILRSPRILDQVIGQLNLNQVYAEEYGSDAALPTTDSRRILLSNLGISQTRNTSKIEVTAVARDPALAADICNEVILQYQEFRLSGPKEKAEKGILALQGKLTEMEDSVRTLEQEVVDMIKEYNIPEIGSGGSITAETLTPELLAPCSRTSFRGSSDSATRPRDLSIPEVEDKTGLQTLIFNQPP